MSFLEKLAHFLDYLGPALDRDLPAERREEEARRAWAYATMDEDVA